MTPEPGFGLDTAAPKGTCSALPPESLSVGDVVWYADVGVKEVEQPCPVCLGKKKVVVILGDDTPCIVACQFCAHGAEEPTGIVREYRYLAEPKQMNVTGKTVRITERGSEVEVYASNHVLNDRTFRTEGEALAKCQELATKQLEEDAERARDLRRAQKKAYSWKAGWHLTEAKRHRAQAEYHERLAVVCRARVKTPDEKGT